MSIVVDQSEAFLQIAKQRMEPFDGRGSCLVARLQDDWAAQLPAAPQIITSMSAIHHLSPDEKQAVYTQAYGALEPLGILLNGDEIRAADDAEFRSEVEAWAATSARSWAGSPSSRCRATSWRRWRVPVTARRHTGGSTSGSPTPTQPPRVPPSSAAAGRHRPRGRRTVPRSAARRPGGREVLGEPADRGPLAAVTPRRRQDAPRAR